MDGFISLCSQRINTKGPELANTIDSGIDIGYFGGIDIDIGIDKRPLQLLVLILVLIRGLPELLAILFIKENTVITASRQRQPTFPSVLLLSLPASLSKTHHGHTEPNSLYKIRYWY